MKKQLTFALLATFFSSVLFATDVDHFKGQPSADLQSALCNLQQFDSKLKAITSKSDITPTDMANIHQLTYTLEVAVQKVQSELQTAADELEKVHKGSEAMDSDKVKQAGQKYLSRTKLLTSNLDCN